MKQQEYCYIIIDLKKRNLITFCIDKSILKETLSYSIPLMPHNLSAQIANLTSRIFINTNYSLSMVGLYSVSTQFSVIIDIIQSSTNQAFTPWFFGIMNNGTKDNKKEIVNLSNFLLTIYSLLYMIIGLFSQDVIILMTSKDYILAWTSVPILVIAYSIKSIYYFYVNILFYYKQASRTLFLATITGSTFDIFLAYILVPLFGIYGAAISFLIAKIIIVIIVIILSKRYDDIGYRAVNMLKIIIPSLLFMGVGLYFSYTKYMSVFSITNFCYKIVLFIIYLIYLYFTNKKAIVEIINSGILKSLFDFKKLNKFERNYMND